MDLVKSTTLLEQLEMATDCRDLPVYFTSEFSPFRLFFVLLFIKMPFACRGISAIYTAFELFLAVSLMLVA